MSNLQKWGIGLIVGAVGALVVGVFAVIGKLPPAVVYTVYGLAIIALGYFGIKVQSAPVPPEEPPVPPV